MVEEVGTHRDDDEALFATTKTQKCQQGPAVFLCLGAESEELFELIDENRGSRPRLSDSIAHELAERLGLAPNAGNQGLAQARC
jgi:hypothetical protein